MDQQTSHSVICNHCTAPSTLVGGGGGGVLECINPALWVDTMIVIALILSLSHLLRCWNNQNVISLLLPNLSPYMQVGKVAPVSIDWQTTEKFFHK